MKTTFLIIVGTFAPCVSAFVSCNNAVNHLPALLVPRSGRTSSLNMGGANGEASTLDGKKKTVENVKTLLDDSTFVFSIPGNALTVAQVESLRRTVPETSTIQVVKNTLMKRATDGTEYEEAMPSLLKGSNMWFFIQDDLKGTVKALDEFKNEYEKTETHNILGGVVDGTLYDDKGMKAISKLPSKLELITKIAGAIKAVPTKVAVVLNQPSTKLVRAIKLATEEVGKDDSATE